MKLNKLFFTVIVSFLAFFLSIYSKDDSTKPDIPAPIITPTTLSAKTPLKTTVYSEISTGETITLGTDNLIISEKGVC